MPYELPILGNSEGAREALSGVSRVGDAHSARKTDSIRLSRVWIEELLCLESSHSHLAELAADLSDGERLPVLSSLDREHLR